MFYKLFLNWFISLSPFKGLISTIRDLLSVSDKNNEVISHSFFVTKNSWGLRGLKELPEACREHFHLSWYLCNSKVPSCGPKNSWIDLCLHFVQKSTFLVYNSEKKASIYVVFRDFFWWLGGGLGVFVEDV